MTIATQSPKGYTTGTLLAFVKREAKRQWTTASAIAVAYHLKGWSRKNVLQKLKDNDLSAMAGNVRNAWSPMDNFVRLVLAESARTAILASNAEQAIELILDEIDKHMARLGVKTQADYYKVAGFKSRTPEVEALLAPAPVEQQDYDEPEPETGPETDDTEPETEAPMEDPATVDWDATLAQVYAVIDRLPDDKLSELAQYVHGVMVARTDGALAEAA